jgi:DNA polymerase kappa
LEGEETQRGSEVNDPGNFEPSYTPEEAMPGFYEHEDRDIDIGKHDDDPDPDLSLPDFQKPRPPSLKPVSESRASDIAKTSASSASKARLYLKPRSMSAAVRPKSSMSTSASAQNSASDSLTCPVCEKVFQTDNDGLNSHIDFCLSRGVIRQAHAEASSPVKKNNKPGQRKDQMGAYSLLRKG